MNLEQGVQSLKCSSPLLRPRHHFGQKSTRHISPRKIAQWVCRSSSEVSVVGSSGRQQLRVTTRKILKQLSSLQLAIGELAAIAGLSVIGTIVKQNESIEYYVQHYPGNSLMDRLISNRHSA